MEFLAVEGGGAEGQRRSTCMHMEEKYVFVTVGTTRFDKLIGAATDKEFLQLLERKGYGRILLQVGSGELLPSSSSDDGASVTVESYRYKDSLKDDLAKSSLVISHGGSGSIFESLTTDKPLIVVINETLMDNHQGELASQLERDGHLVKTNCRSLYHTMEQFDASSLQPYQTGDPTQFGRFIDSVMGFNLQTGYTMR